MIPATAVTSWIVSSNTTQDIMHAPLSSTFEGLIFGGIGGGIIECLAPPPARPLISGGLIAITGATMFSRSMGWIEPPKLEPTSIQISMKSDNDNKI